MASGGHLLQQQKGSVEARIKSLVVNDLKLICRAHNYQVSGTKANLQKRCIEILNTIVHSGDHAGFRDLNFRVNNHGQDPPKSLAGSSSSFAQTDGGYQPATSMPPTQVRRSYQHLPPNHKYFKLSPFYENHEAVLPLSDLPGSATEMPQNRHTVRTVISLTQDVSARLRGDTGLRLLLYCGTGVNQYSVVDVAFPNQLEVKINNDDVKSNFKGLKNKPGSTKPADITDKVRKNAGYQNQLSITYALTQKRYSFAVYLVRHVSADALTDRIKAGRHGGGIITKQRVLDEMHKANSDDDIAATSVRMSLKDPISTMRINLPVRSTVCTHNQCFDGAMFIQLNEQAPQWVCPVCSKSVSYESLCVDKYFEEILQQTPTSIEKVDIEPDGKWHVIKEDAEPKNQSSRDNRAAYDNDFSDDEIVEVPHPEPKKRTSNGVGLGSGSTPSLLSPMPGLAMNTPPLSSRGPSAAPSTSSAQLGSKRPAVIDLTLSDDEEEQPPRPAKRQSTFSSTHTGLPARAPQPAFPSPIYGTRQSSFAPPPPTAYGQNNFADAFRASVNTSRPASTHEQNSNASEFRANSYGLGGFPAARASPFNASNGSSPVYPSASTTLSYDDAWHPPRSTSTSGAAPGPLSTLPSLTTMSPTAGSNTGQQAPQNNNTIRLPPMNQYPADGYASWRNNGAYPGFAHSPPGA